MKKSTPYVWKNALLDSIDSIAQNKATYFENPETAFSRTQKISLRDTILFPMVASNESTSVELLDYFPMKDLPSQAAMSYRRNQLKLSAYQAVFQDFTRKLPQEKNYCGMRVIACDGTRLNTPYNPQDTDSYVNCIEGRKGFNQYHLTTCYDVLNEVFTDAVIQGYYSMNEKLALCTMMDRYNSDNPILFVADRGFSSYNVIAHAFYNKQFFLLRLPFPMAKNIFCDTQNISDNDIMDIEDTFYVGRVRNKISKTLKNYHFRAKNKPYDYIPIGSKEIDSFSVRLVKFPLPSGETEYLLTNLPKNTFSIADLQELYRLRWNVETSFRYLKYASGIIYMHSLKQKFLFQEIFAKLTLYNFCTAVNQCINLKTTANLAHKYVIEKAYLVKSCIRFLKGQLKYIIQLVKKRKVPIRAGRKFERNIRRGHADTLQYR